MSKNALNKRRLTTYFKELFTVFAIFFKIGLFSFGGGYAMLTLIESEVVEKRHWLTHSELGDIFAIAESTPGPIAINTATFIGTKRLGVFGGVIATLGVVIPAFAIIVALSYILDIVSDNKWVQYIFKGISVGVLVLIAKAVISFFKDMRKNVFSFILMIAAFLLVFLTKISVIYIILGTIVICTAVVIAKSVRNSRFYHMSGTAEYYCERVGKPLDKDEYFNETAVESGKIKIKTSDSAISASDKLAPELDDIVTDTDTYKARFDDDTDSADEGGEE